MNRYPLKKQAEELASHGRYGDSVLVHMHPAEVEGIAALTPGGLSTNPVTGQPEAFAFLIPLAASAAGSAMGLSVLTTAALSGAATAAVTGDAKRGLASAVMGAGVGSALNAAGAAGAEAAAAEVAAQQAAGAATTDALGATVADTMVDQAAQQAVEQAGLASAQQAQDVLTQQAMTATPDVAGGYTAAMQTPQTGAQMFDDMSVSERIGATYGTKAGREGIMTGLTEPKNFSMMAMGGQQLEQMEAQAEQEEEWGREAEDSEEKKNERLRRAYESLQRGYAAAQPGARRGPSPYRLPHLPGPYSPPGMNEGGPVPANEETADENRQAEGAATGAGSYPWGYGNGVGGRNPGYQGIDGVTIQRGLRGDKVAIPDNFMAGFGGEMKYFQNLDKGEDPVYPEYTSPMESSQHMWNPSINRFASTPSSKPYFQPVLPADSYLPWQSRQHFEAQFNGDPNNLITSPGGPMRGQRELMMHGYRQNPYLPKVHDPRLHLQPQTPFEPPRDGPPGMAEGGTVPVSTPAGDMQVQSGGLADMAVANQSQGPEPQEVQIVSAAILGQLPQDQADMVINEFIERHGPVVFQTIRDMVLQQQAPGAQTEGMIEGQGSGMEDQVPGTIGNQGPVAVSPGEYIVPADVVSGLGDGSSDSGAERLDEMASNVRAARQGGRIEQPPPVNPDEVMP